MSCYEDHLKWFMTEANSIEKAKNEGIAIGIEKIAKRMLKENTDIKFISSVTGLSTDEILKLQNQM